MAETRSAVPVTQALMVGDRAFTGMDTYTDPNKLQDGFCQRISNLMLQNGSLVPRRGFQAVTTNRVSTTGSYWESFPVKSGRNTVASAILVGEDASGNTRFWKNDANHTDSVPIPMSATGTVSFSNIQPSLVRMAQLGRFVYAAPGAALTGTSNYPLRIDTKTQTQKLTSVTVALNKLTKVGHGLTVGDPIVFVGGVVPAGTSLNTPYYVSHVATDDFYIATALPTTTTATVSNLTFAAGTTVDLVTTFKGETVPIATGLIATSPIAELNPFVVRDIQGNASLTVTTSLTLSSSAALLTNGNFGSSTGTGVTGWTQYTGAKQITVFASGTTYPLASSGNVAQFDEDADGGVFPGLYQVVNCPTETTTIYGSTTIVEPSCVYAVQVRVINYVNTTGNLSAYNNRGIVVRIKAQTSTGGDINGATASAVLRTPPTSNKSGWATYTLVGDFRAFKDQLVSGKIQVELQNITDNGSGGNQGIYVDTCYVYAIPNAPATNSNDVTVDTDTKLVKVYGTKINTTGTAPSLGGYLANRHFYYNVSATTNNWQNQEYVSIKFKHNALYQDIAPSFTIGIQNGSATAITWGGEGIYDADNQWMTFPLNTFPKASRDNVKAVYIRCNGDYLLREVTLGEGRKSIPANDVLFYIGKLVYNGELQNGGKYEYAFTRWKAAPSYTTGTSTNTFLQVPPYAISGTTETFFGGVESPLSKISVPIETTNAQSRLRINLAGDFRDSGGIGYTHLMVYRRNTNTFTDGLFRLVAQIDVYPSTPVLVSSSANVTLEAGATQSQIYLIDNVGDTELLFDGPQGKTGNIFHNGKDFFPQGAETIALHQSRIWMSKNNTLYASWLLDNDNEYNLHTTEVPVLGEPYLPIKGATFDVSGQFDNEPITAIVPFSGEGLTKNNSSSNALLVLRNNSILPVTGGDASTFSILGFVQEAGSGCIAPNCAQTVLGRVWWLSNSGIMQYTGGIPQTVSQQLDRLVNARTHNPILVNGSPATIDQSVMRNASSVFFDNKFIFSATQPGGTYLDTMYVFDFKMNGWSEWQFPKFTSVNPAIRSMYVLNTAVDAPQLYVATSNGHIYSFIGTQDKQTAGSSVEAFTWAVLSRQYGQTYAQGIPYYATNKVSQLDVHINTEAAQTVTWKIYNETQPQLVSPIFNPYSTEFIATSTFAFTAGNKLMAIRNINKYMRGATYSVQLSGSSLTTPSAFRIYSWMLHVSEGGIKRSN